MMYVGLVSKIHVQISELKNWTYKHNSASGNFIRNDMPHISKFVLIIFMSIFLAFFQNPTFGH